MGERIVAVWTGGMPEEWAIDAFGVAARAKAARHAALKKDFILRAFYQECPPPLNNLIKIRESCSRTLKHS
jgi:hypothetical protein